MKTLGEQWIEIIDGQKHMVKVGLSMKGEACRGCIYMGRVDECSHPCGCPMKNQFDPTTIVKDLGPVNEDGVPTCPFCGEYPVLDAQENFDGRDIWFLECAGCGARTAEYFEAEEAINAWKRRA